MKPIPPSARSAAAVLFLTLALCLPTRAQPRSAADTATSVVLDTPRLTQDGALEFLAHGRDFSFLLLQSSSDLQKWTTTSSAWTVDGVAVLRGFPASPGTQRFFRALDESPSFTLSGIAYDFWNNRPLVDAIVRLRIQGFAVPVISRITESDGRFTFAVDLPFTPAGVPYTLTCSPPGYTPWTSTGLASQGRHIETPIIFPSGLEFPPNDAFANRIALTGDQASAVGYNWRATTEFGEPEHDALGTGPSSHESIWWSYTPTREGLLTLRCLDSEHQMTLAVYTGTDVARLSRVTAEQSLPGADGFEVRFRGRKGVEYQIAADSLDRGVFQAEFELRFSPLPETPAYRIDTVAGEMFPTARDGIGSAARFSGPQGLGRDPAGTLWVTDWGNHLLRKVTTDGRVTTVAGLPGNPGTQDGTGGDVRFDSPSDVAFDKLGNAYVTDYGDHTIRKITPQGVVSTLAGRAGQAGFRDGPAQNALFHNPSGITVAADGSVYVVEAWNHTVRRISPQGTVSTMAGSAEQPGHVEGAGTEARFDMPVDVEADGAGNLYVADFNNHVIRRIAADGRVSTVAGLPHVAGSVDGDRTTARLDRPSGLALDPSGNLGFVQGDHTVRRLAPDGQVITLAGLANAAGSADGPARKARFNSPSGIVSDAQGGWWLDDFNNNTVRHLTAAGQVTTLAGLSATNAVDGRGTEARFNGPSGVAVETSGSIIVCDWLNQSIRRILPSGDVVTLAGAPGNRGSEDGRGAEARFSGPADAAVAPDGSIVVAEWDNHALRRLAPDGTVTTLAGDPSVPGWEDGTGSQGHFVSPSGICADAAGNIYVADAGAHVIRKVSPEGACTTIAGTGGVNGMFDAQGLDAYFDTPSDVAIDALGNLFVADSGNQVIRRIAPDGTVSTYAGAAGAAGGADGPRLQARFNAPGLLAFGPDQSLYVVESSHTLRRIRPDGQVETLAGRMGEPGYFDAAPAQARFRFPAGIAVDAQGTAIIADYGNNVVRAVPAVGDTRTLAGLAEPNALDGHGEAARFDGPSGLAVDAAGFVYVPDWNSATIRKVSPQGDVTTLAGSAGHPGTRDGSGRFAQFRLPADVVVDSQGNLFVADTGANTIRKVTPQGVVSTFAGGADQSGSDDGPGTAARFASPGGIGIGPDDTLYVADSGNNTLRRIDRAGMVSTLAGSPGVAGFADGSASEARFNSPADIAVDSLGNLYVADTRNNSIRTITPGGRVTTLAGYRGRPGTADGTLGQVRFQSPIALDLDPSGNLIVADYLNLTLRRVTPAGETTTIAGSPFFPSLADGVGTAARFKGPGGIAIDKNGRIYISDFTGNVIRRAGPAQ